MICTDCKPMKEPLAGTDIGVELCARHILAEDLADVLYEIYESANGRESYYRAVTAILVKWEASSVTISKTVSPRTIATKQLFRRHHLNKRPQ